MKEFKTTIVGHFTKTISIFAENPRQVEESLEALLNDIKCVGYTDKDYDSGEAFFTLHKCDFCEVYLPKEDGNKVCTGCPLFCTECMECIYDEEYAADSIGVLIVGAPAKSPNNGGGNG